MNKFIITTILIYVACGLISFFGAAKDGLSERLAGVGWWEWHWRGWMCRDVALALLFVVLILGSWWNLVGILGVMVLQVNHNRIYLYYRDNRERFLGSAEMPGWFRRLRRIWAWRKEDKIGHKI